MRSARRPTFHTLRALMLLALLSAAACNRDSSDMKGVGVVEEPVATGEFGTYHALVIGINDYSSWPRLKYAENDAREIARLLGARYGFAAENLKLLTGAAATRTTILRELRKKLEDLGQKDNLLVYYAGHGQLDPLTESGYWIPVEGELSDEATWIPFTTVTSFLAAENVQAKNVLVITDSCYGGSLARSGPTPGSPQLDDDAARYVTKLSALATKRSRQVIASGGYEQVPDQSTFATLLKKALEQNELPAVDLELIFFSSIYKEVRLVGQQEPVMARVRTGPDLNGQFVLVRSGGSPATEPPAVLSVASNVDGDRITLDGEPKGSTPLQTELAPGRYTLRIEKDGFLPYEEEVALATGERREVRAELKPQPAQLEPRVARFTVSPAEARVGDPVTLSWSTESADTVRISSLGDVPLSGTRELTAGETTSFELVASHARSAQKARAEQRLTVKPREPIFDYFVSRPDQIQKGQKTTLVWRVQDAKTVFIKGSGTVAAEGSLEFAPEESTEYTLVASNGPEAFERTLTVTVTATTTPAAADFTDAPAPEISLFEVSPSSIVAGQTATLRWRTRHAAQAEIDAGVGVVAITGQRQVSPTRTTTYTLVAAGDGGSAERKIRILVKPRDLTLTPTTPLEAVAAVHKQGTLEIRQTFTADVDEGQVGGVSTQNDVWFNAKTATARFLTPRNGAWLALAGSRAPGLEGCRKATLGVEPLPIDRLRRGTFVCVRTNTGRYAQLEVLDAVGPSPGTLELKFTTWK